jgi:hypothetical protein
MKPIPGICDRCGLRFKLSSLRDEYLLGRSTGLKVCKRCYDESHPQLDTRHVKTNDRQSVKGSRSDRMELADSRRLFGWNPVGMQTTSTMIMGVGRVFVGLVAAPPSPHVTVEVMGEQMFCLPGMIIGSFLDVSSDVFGFHIPTHEGTVEVSGAAIVDVTGNQVSVASASVIAESDVFTDVFVTGNSVLVSGSGNFQIQASVRQSVTTNLMTTAVGDEAVDVEVNGSIIVNAQGSSAAVSVGNESVSLPKSVNVTGQSRTASVGSVVVSTPVFTGFPDSTNTGYLHAPGYPGSLTPWGGGSLTAGSTYSFIDFPASGDVLVNVANVTFIGCRFISNWVDGWQIKVNVNAAVAATFKFCTIRPPMSVSIPHSVWPSGGTGINVDGSTGGGFEPYQIGHTQGYQYGILQNNGGIVVEDCDIWGFGNSIVLFGTHQKTIRRTWIHDAAAEGSGAGQYHTDGPGHLDGSGCSNVLIEDCTIATLGNTNGIAFQTGTYNNIIVRRNFLSGFGVTVDMCHGTAGNTNLTFQDNTIATDVSWHFRPIYTDFTSNFNGATNLWRGNRLRVLAGTVPRPGSTPSFTLADHNKFILPSGGLSTTDFE